MYLIGNELLFDATVGEREREVREMTPKLGGPRRAALRAILAARLAQLAMRIDHDAVGGGSGPQAVDFRSPRPS
jgi:hypothetical protein